MNLKLHHILMGLITAIICIPGLLFAYWAFLDGNLVHPIIKFEDQGHVRTEKSVYHPGEMVRGYVSFCKYRNISPEIQDALIDHTLSLFEPRNATSGVIGCRKELLINLEELPPNLFPDTYHLNRTLKYRVNLIRDVYISLQTNEFEVKK